MSEVYIRSQNKEKLYVLSGGYTALEYVEYTKKGKRKASYNQNRKRLHGSNWRVCHKRALLRGAGRDTESVRKLSVYGWRCSHNKGRHGRTAVCSSNTEAVRNAREVGEADSDSKGIYRHAGEFRPPAHYRGQSRGLRRVSGSVQTVCRP